MVDPRADFKSMIEDNWDTDTGGDIPTIADIRDYRGIDVTNEDYIFIRGAPMADQFFGIGASEFRRNVNVTILIKSASKDRAKEMRDEVVRIMRTKSYWGDYENVLVTSISGMSDRERKIYSYILTISAFVIETV